MNNLKFCNFQQPVGHFSELNLDWDTKSRAVTAAFNEV